ncbi:uncharacterized protein DUF3887 [Mycobacterium sp. BK086]|uniref:DUF3887 domain-containing protein n=1 Tax=Mycobacterium sp. BK086 TaxID=2512165 RepID=UPI00105B29A2|nr:DUF3887 domain-containing protein [Mycobacterium sp. BK086]TDO06479.1 uncharacterized protein DUF3887 [Mycobacterium sp. BK086]
MSAAISGIRVKFGKTDGDVRVTSGGKLVLVGMVVGTLTVESGGYANIIGAVDGLVIEPGARAKLRGLSMGDVTNHGGELTISGAVKGVLRGRSTTRVMPKARIDHFDEPIDPETGEGPLPEAADLASSVIDDLTNARWAEVRARFDARMHDGLSEEELAAVWRQIPGMVGNYEGHGDTDVAREGDLTRTVTRLRFDAGELVARIGFRDDQTIAGLYILNP